MRTIKMGVKSSEVYYLNELLAKLGYSVVVSDNFGTATDKAIKDFQLKNNLVVDGIVGLKTWSILLEKSKNPVSSTSKLLSEKNLADFAKQYGLELAVVKAVNEVESGGKGFLVDGRPKILFEGHIFWKELKKRNIDPKKYSNSSNQNVLFENYNKKYYVGGAEEYNRLEKAASIGNDKNFRDAANSSASWGLFQIMGFNAVSIGYANVDEFTAKMKENEGEHLKAFGLFLKKNNLIQALQDKNWVKFALGYNGPAYKTNKYDEKLKRAYLKYSK